MTYKVILLATAQKDLRKLNPLLTRRIVKKLRYFSEQQDPLYFAKKLNNPTRDGSYRFRIGEYRAAFDINSDYIMVIYVEHRKDVYK